ncbi:MAG: CAP domain-containing protein [Candidatus Paceibacterota bacterium]|jgi:uncharacterized protein YkwD
MKRITLIFLSLVLVIFFVVSGKSFIEKAITERLTAPRKTEKTQEIATSSSSSKNSIPTASDGIVPKKKAEIAVTPKTSSLPAKNPIPSAEVSKIVQTATEPLVSFAADAQEAGALKSSEVIRWTNYNRTQNNLPPLARNSQLDSAAIIKVHDMFERQYFEHVSPTGKGAADIVAGVGYNYLWVGENLALGIFENERDLVDAWMGSPGHRANILNSHYEEIGVAVDEGQFEGRHVWLAVQEFGKPASSCPAPDTALKLEIEQNQISIASSTVRANILVAEIQELEHGGNKELYNQKAGEYNALVEILNSLIIHTRALVETYNNEVASYNACIGT